MRKTIGAIASGLCLTLATLAAAQTPPARNSDTRIESQPADTMQRTPEPSTQGQAAPGSKGDGVTFGKDGDPIGATNDDKGRQGEAHSDPTLATKPAPPSDPKFQ